MSSFFLLSHDEFRECDLETLMVGNPVLGKVYFSREDSREWPPDFLSETWEVAIVDVVEADIWSCRGQDKEGMCCSCVTKVVGKRLWAIILSERHRN